MNIELLSNAGSDATISNAARVSFAAKGDWDSTPEGYTK